jgi:hypothetical protein
MATEYQLKLVNVTPRIRRNTVAGIVGLAAIACGTYALVQQLDPAGSSAIAVAMLAFAVGVLVGIIYYLKAVMVPSLVSVGATELRVRDLRRDELAHCLAYTDIAAYRHQTLNSTEELRLTLTSGERVALKSAANFDTANEFAKMVRAFEQQLAQAAAVQAPAGPGTPAALPVREKGFLEKPLATGLLLAATLVAGLLSWQVAAGHLTVGNVAGALAVYVSYVVAWLAARRRA